MKYMNGFKALILTMALASLFGCGEPDNAVALPEVNDQNCVKSEIAKIKSESARKEFAGRCARTGTDVKRSPDVGLSVK